MNKYRKGIDVSDCQGSINWARVKEDGVEFVVIRSVRGSGKTDNQFYANVSGCILNKIEFDVYKYSYATTVEKAINEANAVVKLMNEIGFVGTVWWDMEDKSLRGLGKNKLTELIKTAAIIIENAGYRFGIYCNVDWYKNVLDVSALDYPFWVARYPSSNPVSIHEMPNNKYKPVLKDKHELFGWQYSSKGRVSGINGNVDLNIIYLDFDDEIPEIEGTGNPYIEPAYCLYRGRLKMDKEYVKWLQWELKELGYNIDGHGGIDGIFGSYTERYVLAAQELLDIKVDGKVGPETRQALKNT